MYENCSPRESECLDRLGEMHGAGIGVVLNYWAWDGTPEQVTAYADRAHELGMQLIWPTYQGSDQDLNKAIALVRDHPATWGYYIGEEAFTGDQAAVVHTYARRIHELDPTHPRLYVGWGGYSVGQHLRPFLGDAEVLAADFYPVGVGDSIERTRAVTRRVTEMAQANGVQPAMVLQAFNWDSEPTLAPPGNHRWPTVDEMRRMRDLSYLVGNPPLMLWFDYYFIKPPGTTDTTHLDAVAKALAAPYPTKVRGLHLNAQKLHWEQSRQSPVTLSYRHNGHLSKRHLSGRRARFSMAHLPVQPGSAKVRIRTVAHKSNRSKTSWLVIHTAGNGKERVLHQA